MKLKEIPRTATFAWSPASGAPLLATGTAAGAIDPDFSSSTQLDLWSLDFTNRSQDAFAATSPIASLETDARFHGLSFSSDGKHIAGALENGVVDVWSVDAKQAKLTSVGHGKAHTGPVKAVAFNPLVSDRLASGGANGQVYVWDLGDLANPTQPGSQSARHDEIEAVAWNNRVPHILATGGNTGFTSIWDLKKKREVLHLHYSTPSGTRVPVSSVAWHPNNSTKLVTGSLDDNEPVVLVWDLRNANSPETVLRGHQRGVLSLDWCAYDSDLLLSSGKDNRTLLWNPTAGKLLGEYPVSVEWSFKTSFHPRLPDLFASASFDGKVAVQTLQDTTESKGTTTTTDTTTKSSGDDFWDSANVVSSVHPEFTLTQAPAWLKRPVSAAFGFGGKIAVVRQTKDGETKLVIRQVRDKEFPEDTAKFSAALKAGTIGEIVDEHKSKDFDWNLLNTLHKKEDPLADVPGYSSKKETEEDDVFDSIGSTETVYEPTDNFKLFDGSNDEVTKLVLAGKLSQAVDKLIDAGNHADALLLASYGDDRVKNKAQNAYLQANASKKSYLRAAWAVAGGHVDDIATRSEISAWPQALNAILDTKEPSLRTAQLGQRLLESGDRDNALLVYLVGSNIGKAAALWLSELPAIEKKLIDDGKGTPYVVHVKALQQIIEKITVANHSVTSSVTSDDDEALYEAYREYADIVSSQGDLDLAKIFLDLLPAKYSEEKERVAAATKPVAATATAKRASVQSAYQAFTPAAAPTVASPSRTPVPATASAYAPSPYAPSAPLTGSAPAAPLASNPYAAPISAPTNGVPKPAVHGIPTNPYLAASTAADSVNASLSTNEPPGVPPQRYSLYRNTMSNSAGPSVNPRPDKGWNDLPEMSATARRTPAAPQIITPSFAVQPAAPPTAPKGPKFAPPPPKTGGAPAPQVGAAQAPSAASPYAPPAGPQYFSTAPEPATSAPPRPAQVTPVNPYAPKASDVSQTKANPYAPASPSPASAAPVRGAPAAAVAPPPPASHSRGPSNVAPPPPSSGAPVASAGAPVSAAAPPAAAAPAKERKYPAGDRSHIPASARPIVDRFSAELERIKAVIEPQFPKQYRDTVRRIDMLFDNLNNEDVLEPNTVSDVLDLTAAISAQDYDRALAIHRDIITTRSEQGGQWATGVKRLIEMGKAVPV